MGRNEARETVMCVSLRIKSGTNCALFFWTLHTLLRSWVQTIPPGPHLSILELQHKLVFVQYRTPLCARFSIAPAILQK